MIKNILFNKVIYVLSEIQNETSRALGTLEPFSIRNKTLFNISDSGKSPESFSFTKKGGKNE